MVFKVKIPRVLTIELLLKNTNETLCAWYLTPSTATADAAC